MTLNTAIYITGYSNPPCQVGWCVTLILTHLTRSVIAACLSWSMRALSFTDSLCNKTRFVVEALARFSPEVGEFSATTNLNLTYRLLPQFFPKKSTRR